MLECYGKPVKSGLFPFPEPVAKVMSEVLKAKEWNVEILRLDVDFDTGQKI